MSPGPLPKRTPDLARQTALSIAWNIPVMILLCTLAGWYVGDKWGQKKVGIVCGWLFGMLCVAYEIWKMARNSGPPSGAPRGDSKG